MKTTPKDFFLYLLSNVALYYCAGWLVSLLWDYVNFSFGTVNYYDTSWIPSTMRWAIASLIIVFPVYIWVTHGLNRDLEANPTKKDLWVRKWLMYLTLALASIAIIIDLVALVNEFLSGEFATTFLLKVLSVAAVAGLVFTYYFYELRRDAGKDAPARSIFRWISIALIAVTVVGGFFIVGSPTTARLRQYDARRINDLQTVQYQITNYWQTHDKLPANLTALNDPLTGFTTPVDPQFASDARVYEYRLLTSSSFEICATFSLAGGGPETGYETKPITGTGNEYWVHGEGRTCFNRSIDLTQLPNRPSVTPVKLLP